MQAKSWGARLAARLLAPRLSNDQAQGAGTIGGDNPLVVKHAAGQARITDYIAASHVEAALSYLGEKAKSTLWLLISRVDNSDAHNAAARATAQAVLLHGAGLLAPSLRFTDLLQVPP